MAQINYIDGSRADLDGTVYFNSATNQLSYADTPENNARVANRNAKPKFLVGDGRGPLVTDGTLEKFQHSLPGDAAVALTLATYQPES